MLLSKENDAKKINAQIQGETFEKDILKRVIRENWNVMLKDTKKSDTIALNMLNEHAAKMGRMLKTFDYEALCVPNIITNSKGMSTGELRAYLNFLEMLATGYSYGFDNEFVSTFLAGLTLKSRDLLSIKKHFDRFIEGVEGKSLRYNALSKMEEQRLGLLHADIKKRESSFFRFFKKGEISLLTEQSAWRAKRIKRYSDRALRYSNLLLRTKGVSGGLVKAAGKA